MISRQSRLEQLSGSEGTKMKLPTKKPILICVDIQLGFLEKEVDSYNPFGYKFKIDLIK